MDSIDLMTLLASLGGASAVAAGLSLWLGNVWANRIARTEAARLNRELESLRAELKLRTDADLDALVRRRDVYRRLANSMRVFFDGESSSGEAQNTFLQAYDEACLWASESVVDALGQFIDLLTPNSVGQRDSGNRKSAYARCIVEMRKDSGFPDTHFNYRVVRF